MQIFAAAETNQKQTKNKKHAHYFQMDHVLFAVWVTALDRISVKKKKKERKHLWHTEKEQRWSSFVFLAGLRQPSIPTAVRQKEWMANTAAEAVYIMWIWPCTYGWCRNREPGVLISSLQTMTHRGFLLSALATVCSLFVQLSMSTVLLNSCAVFFLQHWKPLSGDR